MIYGKTTCAATGSVLDDEFTCSNQISLQFKFFDLPHNFYNYCNLACHIREWSETTLIDIMNELQL